MPQGQRIRKAMIPAAGFGTRLLPATKVVPKEMLPVASKPLIQHAVEEAAASGIETIILVIRQEKSVLQEHFKRDSELELFLESRGRKEEADLVRRLSNLAEVLCALQDKPRGLAHAASCARHSVGEEPFAVITTPRAQKFQCWIPDLQGAGSFGCWRVSSISVVGLPGCGITCIGVILPCKSGSATLRRFSLETV